MPLNRTVNTQAMLSAAESGQEGVRKAADRAQQESQFSREHALRSQSQVNSEFQQQQQIDEQKRSNLAREGMADRELSERSRSNRMGEAIQQDAQDVEMADKGLESKGGSRADRLRQEMDRGAQQTQQKSPEDQAADARYKAQSEKGIEIAGPDHRSIAPTAERSDQEHSKLVTNRLNAQANMMNAARSYQEAKMSGNVDGMKKEMQNLQQPIKSAAALFDAGKNGKLADSQWENIKALAGDAPDPQLQQEIATKTFGPATGRILQARVNQSAVQFMAVTGDMPDGDLVDMASPAMMQFTQNASQLQNYLKVADINGTLSQALNIVSMADRNRIIRKLTAQAMLNQKANPGAGSVIPSQGQPSAQPAAGTDFSSVGRQLAAGAAGGGAARGAAGKPAGQPAQQNGAGSGWGSLIQPPASRHR